MGLTLYTTCIYIKTKYTHARTHAHTHSHTSQFHSRIAIDKFIIGIVYKKLVGIGIECYGILINLFLLEFMPPPKRSTLTSFMANLTTPSSTETSTQIPDYLLQPPLPEDAKPLEFWRDNRIRYPILSQLAMKYLSIPASSAPTGCMCKLARKVFRPERCRLTDSRFEEQKMVRCIGNLHRSASELG